MDAAPKERLRILARGCVQGVGFRPHVHRLATNLGVTGWVRNCAQGVSIEVEGPRRDLEGFLRRLAVERPPNSFIEAMETWWLASTGYDGFKILESNGEGQINAIVMPDLATCPDCLEELFDPGNRRFHYPFINCTHCGPRYSIVEALPYDRARTSMRPFVMCEECAREYNDPENRRFHAEPNACPNCGPFVELWDLDGRVLSQHGKALLSAAQHVRDGKILALKGIGGFQLIVNASNQNAVQRLRARKHREEKPFALMYPSLYAARCDCEISEAEAGALQSPASPIVLLRRLREEMPLVAPGNPRLGVMLPYSPLHHLLMRELGFPVVATSGNRTDEPICIDENESLTRLDGIADVYLAHNRRIVRHVDDSIVHVMLGREQVLRRARGYAPLPLPIHPRTADHPQVIAVGAHLKSAVALASDGQAFVSQHIGDLETVEAFDAFRRAIADLQNLYGATPGVIVSDTHPDYLSTKFADSRRGDSPSAGRVRVQHHIAHVLACLAENEVALPSLGVCWDGTGLGVDGSVWGGEFFVVTRENVERIATFRRFRLPGGDQAVQEPRRSALGVLYEIYGPAVFAIEGLRPVQAFSASWLPTFAHMLKSGLNSPWTSSAGRLFDAVAALIGLRQQLAFEGQAAMDLEFAMEGFGTDESYAVRFDEEPIFTFDWQPMIAEILRDLREGASAGVISAKFHNTLAEVIVAVARRAGQPQVALSGGCFQNRYLTERAARRLEGSGFRPFWHQRIPPNDGGIAYGQIIAALRNQR